MISRGPKCVPEKTRPKGPKGGVSRSPSAAHDPDSLMAPALYAHDLDPPRGQDLDGHDTHTPCCPYASTHNAVHWAYNVRVCEGRSGSLFLNREGHQETQGLNPIWARQRARNGFRSLSIATTPRSIEKALWSSWDPLEAFLLRWRVPA